MIACLSVGMVVTVGLSVRVLCGLRRVRAELGDVARGQREASELRDHFCAVAGLEACRLSMPVIDHKIEKLRRSLAFYKKLEAVTPDDKLWRLRIRVPDPFGPRLFPAEFPLPSEATQQQLELLAAMRVMYHGNGPGMRATIGRGGDPQQPGRQDALISVGVPAKG